MTTTLQTPELPGFDGVFKQVVQPFRPKPNAWEFKIMALRECPLPLERQLCDTPEACARYWREHIATEPRFQPECECLAVLLLNTRRRLLGHHLAAMGTHDTLLVHPLNIYRLAVATGAAAIVVMRNHPSGDPSPSEADIKVTRDLMRAGQVLRIDLLDHVIVGQPRHVSLREQGYFA